MAGRCRRQRSSRAFLLSEEAADGMAATSEAYRLLNTIGRLELAYGQTVLRTVRAVEAGGGFIGPAAAVAAGAAVVAAAVAKRAVATAAVALHAAGVELRRSSL
jgi:hypothetical protein